jgi:hypothetical protein
LNTGFVATTTLDPIGISNSNIRPATNKNNRGLINPNRIKTNQSAGGQPNADFAICGDFSFMTADIDSQPSRKTGDM